MTYEVVNLIIPAADRDTLNQLLDESGIEGCVNVLGFPCWPENTQLVYLPSGEVDLTKSPPPSHYMATGHLHVDAIALLPESIFEEVADGQETGPN